MQKAYPRRDGSRDKLLEQIESSVAGGVMRLPEENRLDVRDSVSSKQFAPEK